MLIGTLGYSILEGYDLANALYLTIITVATVGYGDMVPVTPGGKMLTVLLVLIGVSFVMYILGTIVENMVEGGLREILGRHKMKKQLQQLSNHYIVCGHGRIGSIICETLHDNRRPFVVIEQDENEVQNIIEKGYLKIAGEAYDDDTLVKAGIERAAGLIAVVSSDADNVFITLSAKGLNPNVKVLARSSGSGGAEIKLKRAGADKVISPYYIGGRRMAQFMIRPNVTDFIDLAMYTYDMALRLEEILVTQNAPINGLSLLESNLRRKYNIIVIGIKSKGENMQFNPQPDVKIQADDILIVLGQASQIAALEKEMQGE